MAGAHALGGFVSLDEGESFAIEYWPLELYKLSLAPPPGELQGKVALVTGAAGGIGRAVVDVARVGRRVRRRLRPRRGGRRRGGRGARRRGVGVGGDVTSEDAVAAAFAAAVEAYGGVDIVVSNAGVASSAPIEETTLAEWERNHAILGTGYFLVAREAFRVLRRAGPRRLDRLRRLQERARRRQERRRLLVGQGRRAAPRALPGRGGRRGRHPRQHRQPRRGPPGLAHLGLELARGARRRLRDRARRARGALPQAHDARREHPARGHRRGGPALRVRARSGKSTGNVLNVDGGVPGAYPR